MPGDLAKTFFSQSQRLEYFMGLLKYLRKSPAEYPDPSNRKRRVLEVLPVAPAPPPREKTKSEVKTQLKEDRQMLNYLKIQLQPIMDQINRKYKKLRQPVIPLTSLSYLFDESDPNYVRPDVAHAQPRPFEIVQDKDGTAVLRETSTGKTFYNLETTTIEERLSNGFYARPSDFLKDIRSLAKDAKNVGDRERTLKANELEANVEVDVATIEDNSRGYDWAGLFARQLQRAKETEEKARKHRAAQSILGLVQSDATGDSDAGPLTLGAPVPGTLTTTARFLPMGANTAPDLPSQSNSNKVTNGTSVPSRAAETAPPEEDTQMADSPMAPPSQWPRIHPRSQGESGRATVGTTQVSQRSALTALPRDVDPATVINEASTTTTKPSHESHRSSENWTQITNGMHPHSQFSAEQGSQIPGSQIPDTQPTLADDAIFTLGGVGAHLVVEDSPTSSQQNRYSSRPPVSASQRQGSTHAQPTMANILNEPWPEDLCQQRSHHNSLLHSTSVPSTNNTSLLRNSGLVSSSSQPTYMINEGELARFVQMAAEKTIGFTVEQLEQVYREIMDELWRQKDQWNRMTTLNDVTNAFNRVVKEMDDLGLLPSGSQEA